MKSMPTLVSIAVFALVAFPVIAHHPAADIVDEDIYAMIDDGLLSYTALLDGDVTLSIDFISGKMVSVTIIQVEDPADSDDTISDKSYSDLETKTFGGLKAGYR